MIYQTLFSSHGSEVKLFARLMEVLWLFFCYRDQTSIWVSYSDSVLYRQVPGAVSGCTSHKIKGTASLTCHKTAYCALYASLPVFSTTNTTWVSRLGASLTGHTECLVGRSASVTSPCLVLQSKL